MSSVLVYHPIGLGDHFACAGIVREYAKRYDRVGLFCAPANYPSVAFLYRDLPNVTIELMRSHRDASRFLLQNALRLTPRHYTHVQWVGTFSVEDGVQYEQQFYQMAGVPFSALWDSFHVERDTAKEQALFDKLYPGKPFYFLHDDNRFPIDPERLPRDLAAVRPAKELAETVFEYGALIEAASELHVVDSSFMFLIDCMPYNNPSQKLFVHRYTRPNMPWNLPILKKPWTILT